MRAACAVGWREPPTDSDENSDSLANTTTKGKLFFVIDFSSLDSYVQLNVMQKSFLILMLETLACHWTGYHLFFIGFSIANRGTSHFFDLG